MDTEFISLPEPQQRKIILAGISFLKAITESYGPASGPETFAAIANHLPGVSDAIWMKLLGANTYGSCTVTCNNYGQHRPNKILVIKTIREYTHMSLVDAKNLADSFMPGTAIINIDNIWDKSEEKFDQLQFELRQLGIDVS